MANTSVKGRVVYAGTDEGIKGLAIVAVDFDPLFSEEILNKDSKPVFSDDNGFFSIAYSPDQYRVWVLDRNPDIVVRIYGSGLRLLHQTAEHKDVTDSTLPLTTVNIHRANIEGWLVTNATLDPTNPDIRADGTPTTWTTGNDVVILKDGEMLFPLLTDAINQASTSIHFMNMNFWLGKNLVTKFIPDPPPDNVPVNGLRVHEILKSKAATLASTNILVQDIPFFGRIFGADTDGLVEDFFKGSGASVRSLPIFLSLLNLPSFMHAKAVIIDGKTAFVLGSTMSQSYFGAQDHMIQDRRHRGSLIHDISVKVVGPAVEHIDRTFTTVWNAAESSSALSPTTGQAAAAQPGIGVQIVRTLPGGTFTTSHTGGRALPHGETGALEAYQRAIAQARNFIYLEDQYFTAPEIFDALLQRMQMPEASKLEVILVMNAKPDVSGYPEKQIQLIKQFRSDLVKALGELVVKKRLGLFTTWSCQEVAPKYEIMPIYIHSKSAIVDDVWATVGSANLDGASLNQIQLATIVEEKLADQIEDGKWWKRLMMGIVIWLLTPLVIAIVTAVKIGTARPTQHANPGQARQPTRSTELNVVICEKQPDPTILNRTVAAFRQSLWGEHLGLTPPLPVLGTGWVDFWNQRANDKLKNLQLEPSKPAGQRAKHPAKILVWQPEKESEPYLRALGVKTNDLKIRSEADKFDFATGTWEQ
jgi:phosphatidylserine/phosphatidylglycerophosphate/cardiolipin synthase-like enzyme